MMLNLVSEEKLKDKLETGGYENLLLDALDQLNKNQLAEKGECEATLNKTHPENHEEKLSMVRLKLETRSRFQWSSTLT